MAFTKKTVGLTGADYTTWLRWWSRNKNNSGDQQAQLITDITISVRQEFGSGTSGKTYWCHSKVNNKFKIEPGRAVRFFQPNTTGRIWLVEDLVFNGNASSFGLVRHRDGSGNYSRCIFSNNGNGHGIQFNVSGRTFVVQNCLAYNNDAGGFFIKNGNVTFTNCNARNNGGKGFDQDGGTVSAFNCISSDNGSLDFDKFTITDDYCVSKDNSAIGLNSKNGDGSDFTWVDSEIFVNVAGEDFHLKDTRQNLFDGIGSFTTDRPTDDYDLVVRSNFDTGAYQFIVATNKKQINSYRRFIN